jgi:hypothetical protein
MTSIAKIDLLLVLNLKQDSIVDQHARHEPGLTPLHGRQPQHVGATGFIGKL